MTAKFKMSQIVRRLIVKAIFRARQSKMQREWETGCALLALISTLHLDRFATDAGEIATRQQQWFCKIRVNY